MITSSKNISVVAARDFLIRLFEKAGCSLLSAQIAADAHLCLSLRGIDTHGLRRVSFTVRRLVTGCVNPNLVLDTVREGAGFRVFDGRNGLGPVCAHAAMAQAVGLARERGIGIGIVRNTSHFLAPTPYLLQAVEHGCFAFACCNCPPGMAGEGAGRPVIGNNPFGYAFPTGLGFPIVFDVASSAVSVGKIWEFRREELPIPLDWGLDASGKPTSDPHAVKMLLPFAGHKGFGAALGVEVLAGVLSGGAILSALVALQPLENWCHFYLVLNIADFIPFDEFLARTAELVTELRATPMPEGAEVRIPGERAFRVAEQRRAFGIPIEPDLIEELDLLAAQLQTPGLFSTM